MANQSPDCPGLTPVNRMENVAQWLNGIPPIDPLGELASMGGGIRPQSRGCGSDARAMTTTSGGCGSDARAMTTTSAGCGPCCNQCHYVNVMVSTPCCSNPNPCNDNNNISSASPPSTWPTITGAYAPSVVGAPACPVGPMTSSRNGSQDSTDSQNVDPSGGPKGGGTNVRFQQPPTPRPTMPGSSGQDSSTSGSSGVPVTCGPPPPPPPPGGPACATAPQPPSSLNSSSLNSSSIPSYPYRPQRPDPNYTPISSCPETPTPLSRLRPGAQVETSCSDAYNSTGPLQSTLINQLGPQSGQGFGVTTTVNRPGPPSCPPGPGLGGTMTINRPGPPTCPPGPGLGGTMTINRPGPPSCPPGPGLGGTMTINRPVPQSCPLGQGLGGTMTMNRPVPQSCPLGQGLGGPMIMNQPSPPSCPLAQGLGGTMTINRPVYYGYPSGCSEFSDPTLTSYDYTPGSSGYRNDFYTSGSLASPCPRPLTYRPESSYVSYTSGSSGGQGYPQQVAYRPETPSSYNFLIQTGSPRPRPSQYQYGPGYNPNETYASIPNYTLNGVAVQPGMAFQTQCSDPSYYSTGPLNSSMMNQVQQGDYVPSVGAPSECSQPMESSRLGNPDSSQQQSNTTSSSNPTNTTTESSRNNDLSASGASGDVTSDSSQQQPPDTTSSSDPNSKIADSSGDYDPSTSGADNSQPPSFQSPPAPQEYATPCNNTYQVQDPNSTFGSSIPHYSGPDGVPVQPGTFIDSMCSQDSHNTSVSLPLQSTMISQQGDASYDPNASRQKMVLRFVVKNPDQDRC